MQVQEIMQIVTGVTGVTQEDITGNSRKTNIILARHLSLWASRWNTSASLQKIAAIHNLTQHGTVIHASTSIENQQKYNEKISTFCKRILNQINNN